MIHLACQLMLFSLLCISDRLINSILFLFTVNFYWCIQLQRLKQGGDRALYENQLLTLHFFFNETFLHCFAYHCLICGQSQTHSYRCR